MTSQKSKSAYSALKTFRENYKKLSISEAGQKLTMPKPTLELIEQFLNEGANRQDITALIFLLCHEEKCDWDSIAHHFL